LTLVIATLLAALFGALLAISELVSRYRDDPARAVFSWPASLYVGLNVAASAGAFGMIRTFGWDFSLGSSSALPTQVLVAGFGSAALFRSSLFNVTIGDQVLGVGPSAVLNVVLAAADRAVDRKRAQLRSELTRKAMAGVSFETEAESLAMYCFAAMQNTSQAELKAINDKVLQLQDPRQAKVPDQIKAFILGLVLQAVVGDRVLREAVLTLKAARPKPAPEAAEATMETTDPAGNPQSAILLALATHGEMSPRELQDKSALPLGDFSQLLEDLTKQGLIVIRGIPGKEAVALLRPNNA
jgi:hypothetical protein